MRHETRVESVDGFELQTSLEREHVESYHYVPADSLRPAFTRGSALSAIVAIVSLLSFGLGYALGKAEVEHGKRIEAERTNTEQSR